MSGRIVLARHGRPWHEGPRLVSPAGLRLWTEAYDRAGIRDDAPADLLGIARQSATVASSTLVRATASLERLGRRADHASALFREARLPWGRWRAPLMPAPFWALLFRCRWLLGYHGEVESYAACRARAALAAAQLRAWAEHGDVLLMGHGLFNGLIGHDLASAGWRAAHSGYPGYWSYRIYQPPLS